MMTDRLTNTARLYRLLDNLEARLGGARVLADCNGRMKWPERGVYFSLNPAKRGRGPGTGSCAWEPMR